MDVTVDVHTRLFDDLPLACALTRALNPVPQLRIGGMNRGERINHLYATPPVRPRGFCPEAAIAPMGPVRSHPLVRMYSVQ